jgi:hypothetical protein
MFLGRLGENEDVVQAGEIEVESPQNVVHEVFERLGSVAKTEEHEGALKEAEWSGNGDLPYIVGMDGDLVVFSYQVDLGKDGTT